MSLFSAARDQVNSLKYSKIVQTMIKNRLNTYIFPLDFLTVINNTESGIKSSNFSDIRSRFYQWESLLPGNDTVFLNWEKATILEQVNDNYKNHWKTTYSAENAKYYKTFRYIEDGSTDFGVSDWGSFGTFTNTFQITKLRLQMIEKIELKMLTQFFLCPQLSNIDNTYDNNQIYRISGFTNYCDVNGIYTYSDVELSSVNDELAQSGQAIQQKFKFSSPGSGYAFPKIIFDDYGKATGFKINEEFAQDVGVRAIQIEVVGNAVVFGIDVFGYPLNESNNPNNNIYAPRKLLIQDFRLPVQEDFLIVSNNSNNFYYGDVKLVGTTSFDSWQTRRKEIVGDKQMDYQGLIEFSHKETTSTNTSNKSIADRDLVISDDFLKKIGTNGIINTEPSYWFYDGKIKDESGKLVDGLGFKQIDLTKMTRKRFSDLINIFSFAINYINLLPYELNSKVSWSLRNIFIIGGFLNKITWGFPIVWRQVYKNSELIYPSLQVLPGIINKDAYDFFTSSSFASNLNPDGNLKKIPLDVFQNAESSTLGAIFGNKSTTTTFNFTITDKCLLARYKKDDSTLDYVPASTVAISQTMIVDGTNYYFKMGEKSYSLDKRVETQFTDIIGNGSYVVTGIGIRMLGDGDIRITCYKDDLDILPTNSNPINSIIYQSIIKSQAGYRNGQIREWLTFQKMSFIEAITQWNQPFEWPEAYPEPMPEINFNQIYQTIENKGAIFKEKGFGIGNEKSGEINVDQLLIYDFGQLGLTTSEQVRNIYDYIRVPEGIFSAYAKIENYREPLPGKPGRKWREIYQELDNILQSVNKSFSNIGDVIPNKGNFDSAIDTNITARFLNRYSESSIHIEYAMYLDGAKLMMIIRGNYYLKFWVGFNDSETYGSDAFIELRQNGGDVVIVPKESEEIII